MSFKDWQEETTWEVDSQRAQEAHDTLMFALAARDFPSLDPHDYCAAGAERRRIDREIDNRIYFGLRLPR